MFFYRKLIPICCMCLFLSGIMVGSPAVAMTQNEAEHVRSAFLFSNRKQWRDAILHAKNSNSYVLQTLVEWQSLLDKDSESDFFTINQFLVEHPDWPERRKLLVRAESELAKADIKSDEIIEWFSNTPPITGVGKLTLANALQKSGKGVEKTGAIIRDAWINGDFSDEQGKELLEKYASMIRPEDDIARANRLAWEGKYSSIERMSSRLTGKRKDLYLARAALQNGKKNAQKLVAKLSSEMKNDVGLFYDRLLFAYKKDDDAEVWKLLLSAPNKIPYPEKWWKIREAKIYEAIGDGNMTLANRLLANHGQEENQQSMQGFSDASWLKGRLLLVYKKQPKEAFKVFQKMFNVVKYPVSKARASYWAGRALRQAGEIEEAKKWFNIASAYPTTFYGQLASVVYHGTAPLRIPAAPVISDEVRAEFNARSMVQAVKLCVSFNEFGLAEKLINHLVADADEESEALLASELGIDAGKIYLSVRGSKKAIQRNVVSVLAGYPIIKTVENLAIPTSLAFAITRQESEFDNMAKSPAGALGMMQLLPTTAEEVARRNDIAYEPQKLYDTEYNMMLGSLYLKRMIDNYNGSLVMAIAAYNAGMGNVYKWVKRFGRPAKNVDGVVDWIENIPFSETRNYVQRVLENLQVYRYVEGQRGRDAASVKLLLSNDLIHYGD